MQDDANDIQTRMSEIRAELTNVSSQMQVYEKADAMKKQLDEKIAAINNDFDKLENFQVAADSFKSQFEALCRMNDEAEKRIDGFVAAQNQIDKVEQDYNRLITMSGSTTQKFKELNQFNDEIQNYSVKIRKFNETMSEIEQKYDRLDKKNETIDFVTDKVDKSFENLKELEDKLANCNRQIISLPNEISGVQKNVDLILKNSKHIDAAVDKLESLQKIGRASCRERV